MARIFAVNENNDIYATTTNQLALTEDIDAVAQNVEQVVRTLFKELYFNRTRGVDYFGLVFTGNPNLPRWEGNVRALVTEVADVTSILDFTYEVNNSIMTYRLVIQTTFGEATVEGGIDGGL